MLWYQRLGHPCDEYVYNAHKGVDGVPKFAFETAILSTCPTYKQSKLSRMLALIRSDPPRVRTKAFGFSFSGMASKDETRRVDYEGLNGETS